MLKNVEYKTNLLANSYNLSFQKAQHKKSNSLLLQQQDSVCFTSKNHFNQVLVNPTTSFNGCPLNAAQFIEKLELAETQESPLYKKFKAGDQPSVLEFIKKNRPANPQDAVTFLFNITKDPELATEFIKEVASDPRKTRDNYNKLKRFVGGFKTGEQMFKLWLNDEACGYKKAYADYYNNVFWPQAKSLEEVVKMSPNLAPWALTGKAEELQTDFVMGKVPESLGDLKKFRALVKEIKETDFFKTYIDAKNIEADPATRAKIAAEEGIPLSNTIAIVACVGKRVKSLHKKSFKLKDGITVKPYTQSLSAKLILEVQTRSGEKFFMKMDPYRPDPDNNTDEARKIRENQDLRPDMPYSNALVDFYLKLNGSKNAADVRFYDHTTDTILYGATEGKDPENLVPQLAIQNLFLFRKLQHVQELQSLGIQLNDAAPGNFLEAAFGNLALIDSGHVYYSDPLRPMIPGRNFVLGNLCGRECRDEN